MLVQTNISGGKMHNNIEILKMRILTCFIKMSKSNCNVTGLAKSLSEEKYAVSRAMKSLESSGLLDRSDNRCPVLTDKGQKLAYEYADKIDIVANHLLGEGVNPAAAKQDAFLLSMYCTNETLSVIKEIEDKMRIKQVTDSYTNFTGKKLCHKLGDGTFELQFVMYKNSVKNNTNISMANEGFYHPCTLTVEKGEGLISLKAKNISRKSRLTGKKMNGKVSVFRYFDGTSFVEAERQGNIVTFPIEAMNFITMGESRDRILHGSLPVRLGCSVGCMHMPESPAIFTLIV